MQKLQILILIPFLFFCKADTRQKDDKQSVLLSMSLLFARSSRLTVSGTAVKGIIKKGAVTINPLGLDGRCDTKNILAIGSTDDSGNYSLFYNKTGGIVCLNVAGNAMGQTTLFDEKTNSDISLPPSSSFNLVTILPESKILNNSRKNAVASPFSKLLARRLQTLVQQADLGTDINREKLYKQSGKEIVIRFGLNSGLSGASQKASYQPKTTNANLSDADFPEIDDILIELENPSSPLTAKFTSILAGFSYLASKYKKDGNLSVTDIDSIIEAFASDFEDGKFDGKTASNQQITIGHGTNQIIFPSDPLTSLLLPAILSYLQEGGKLKVGRPSNITPPTFTSTQVASQTQFVDNATIIISNANGLDSTTPSVGGSGTLTMSSITANTIPISWTIGADETTPSSSLRYIVYYSTTASHVNSLANINAFSPSNSGILTNATTYTLSALSASTTYYFNVVVKDMAGNKAIYTSNNSATNAVSCAAGASANHFGNNYYLTTTSQSCDSLCASLSKTMNLTNTNLLNNNGGACATVLIAMGCSTGTTNVTGSCTTPSCHYFSGGPSREDCGNTMNPATAYGADQMVCQCN